MSRTLSKVLLASTAFVATVAGSANAVQTVTTSLTTVQTTSDTTGGINVSNVGSIMVPADAAINISGSVASDNVISVSTGGLVSNTGAAATISYTGTGSVAATINNSGTITNASTNGEAINLSTSSAGVAINNAGTISGSMILTTGNDTFTVTGGSVSGTINGLGGTDTLNVSGTSPFTIGYGISNVENINISNTTNIRAGITGADTVRIGAGAVANVSTGFATGTGGSVIASGTLNVGARQVVSATNFNFNAGVLGITIDSSNTTTGALDAQSAGQLVVEDAAGSFRGGSLTISLGSNVGYIASGTTYRIVSSTAAGVTTPSLTTATNGGLYTYRIANVGTGSVSLTIERAATSSLATSSVGKAVATQLDSIGTSARGDILTIQQRLNAATSAATVNNIVESLAPGANTGAGLAAIDTASSNANNISTRLASLRSTSLRGVATGDKASSNHVWVQGFGSTATQDNKNGNFGYDTKSAGATFGADTDTLVDGVTTGLAFGYGHSTVDGKASSNPNTDVNSYMLTAYGSQVMGDGLFVNGQLGLGYNNYDFSRRVSGFTTDTTGSTHGAQGSVKAEVGKDFKVDAYTLTPLASAQYTYLKMNKYTETGPAALAVDPKSLGALDLGIGAQAAMDYALADGQTLRPVVRAKYIYRAGDTALDTTSRFVAGGVAFDTKGAKADRSSVNLGLGLTLTEVAGADLSLDYDADIRSSYTGHTGQLKAKWAF